MNKVDKYCRLCAEPTEHLIYADEEAAFNSKIAKKMLWINIDVTPSNKLPKSICYSCFDQLERTWIFLKNVREAQEKLNQLFSTNNEHKVKSGKQSSDVANPVDMNWDDFQDVKVDIKDEDIMTVITTNKFIDGLENLKTEQCPENDQDFLIEDNGFSSSTDSEQPSDVTVKKKRNKKKVSEHNEDKDKTLYIEPVDIDELDVTWEEEACRCGHCDAQCKNISLLRFKTRLNLHLRQHTGAKPYNCVQCQRDFTNGSNYKKHMKRRHNIDTSSIWKKYISIGNGAVEESKDTDDAKT
ncbi:Zinc finger protein 846 [Papilio xuthus]|uniref:Zinc finger protein 846 n=1 Tax=Papilio xuthus TaxID=66420 RepID=A0A194PZX8_PAPXU|nr:Zinc finger protein 846 [Papilio xuthus]